MQSQLRARVVDERGMTAEHHPATIAEAKHNGSGDATGRGLKSSKVASSNWTAVRLTKRAPNRIQRLLWITPTCR